MKTLTIWQPWASLIIAGIKNFETRGWSTKYRGPLLIHAASQSTGKQIEFCMSMKLYYPEIGVIGHYNNLPLGAIIGVVDLHTVYPADEFDSVMMKRYKDWRNIGPLVNREKELGDYSEGRYFFDLRNPKKLEKPYPVKGTQKFWEFDESLITNFPL